MSEKTKDYELTIVRESDHIHALVKGHDSLAVSTAYIKELLELCKEEHIEKLLIEEDLSDSLSVTEIYEVSTMITDELAGSGIKIAHYDRHQDQLELNKFAETVAVNRGLQLREFRSLQDAKNWLLEKSEILSAD